MAAGGIAEICGPILIGGLRSAGAEQQRGEQHGPERKASQAMAMRRLMNC
jgi:hypothetical protein